MLKGKTKHEDKEHGKTLKHEASGSINHKATQNKNNTGTTALERSVAEVAKEMIVYHRLSQYLRKTKHRGSNPPHRVL